MSVHGHILVFMLLFSSAVLPRAVRGDGGMLRAWKQDGAYDIAVFTDPTPFVTGPVDISVLLLDRETGEAITDARVMVEVSPAGLRDKLVRHRATRQAATNKLLHAAVFEIDKTGPFRVIVDIESPRGHSRIPIELNVGSPWTPRIGLWPWILWPVPVILLYVAHRRLVAREMKGDADKRVCA